MSRDQAWILEANGSTVIFDDGQAARDAVPRASGAVLRGPFELRLRTRASEGTPACNRADCYCDDLKPGESCRNWSAVERGPSEAQEPGADYLSAMGEAIASGLSVPVPVPDGCTPISGRASTCDRGTKGCAGNWHEEQRTAEATSVPACEHEVMVTSTGRCEDCGVQLEERRNDAQPQGKPCPMCGTLGSCATCRGRVAASKTSDSSRLDTGLGHTQTRASDEQAGTANAAAPSPGGAPKSPGATTDRAPRRLDAQSPFCGPCNSYHPKPTSKEHHAALRCTAPFMPTIERTAEPTNPEVEWAKLKTILATEIPNTHKTKRFYEAWNDIDYAFYYQARRRPEASTDANLRGLCNNLEERATAAEQTLEEIRIHASGECRHTADERMQCFAYIERIAGGGK